MFRNLPDAAADAEGDAIAIIADDPDHPGPASATVRLCRFTGIGQGIHTRYAHLFVEGCQFSRHNGDNDDIDLFGESLPPSLIVNNTFLDPDSDDALNPTRSSAVMINNLIGHTGTRRQGDSGVVLRDRGSPVMINNVIFNCNSAGIDVQNTCNALLINNSIHNCGTAVNFRDHTTRWGYPYFLTPGAAKATLINTLVWGCGRSLNLVDSPAEDFPGSEATVQHCNIEGGAGSAAVAPNSTLVWDDTNLDAPPLLADPAANDYHLQAGSPCVDAGTAVSRTVAVTNLTGLTTNLTITANSDCDGLPRPLDGDGDGTPAPDIGAYEYLLAAADSNGDGVPDGWYAAHGLNPADPAVGQANPDQDPHTNAAEYIADTDPTDPESFLRIEALEIGPPLRILYRTSVDRLYTLRYVAGLGDETGNGINWTEVTGQVDQPGSGGLDNLADPDATGTIRHYAVDVSLP